MTHPTQTHQAMSPAPNPFCRVLFDLFKSPWIVWIGLRYLKSKKNSKFLSFITSLSILGVGLGVTAMIVVLSIMDGFETELKKRLMAFDVHVLIQPTRQTPGFDAGFIFPDTFLQSQIEEIKKNLPILHFWPIISTEAILKSKHKITGVLFKGISTAHLEEFKKQLIEVADPRDLSSDRLPSVFMGQALGYELRLIPGDELTLISPMDMQGPLGGIPRFKKYVIEGLYHSGLPEQELHTLFAHEDRVRTFLKRPNRVSQWEVTLQDFDQAPQISAQIQASFPLLKVQHWQQLNAHLYASLRLERLAMFVILAFIIIVASFNIVTTLTLMVLEKQKEISILKAMGAQNHQVSAIFLAEGLLIGGLGITGGVSIGFLICLALKKYEFITLPDVFFDRTLPVSFYLHYYIAIIFTAFVIVCLACLYPSYRAAQLNPLEGIRFGK